MAGSRTFKASRPYKEHLQRGSGGVQAEVRDLRKDVDCAFMALETSGQLGQYTVAATPPTVADDNVAGYVRFSQWLDTSTGSIYECIDAATGAAVWHEITNFGVVPGGLVASVFGRTGVVTSALGDYAASQVTNDSSVAGAFVSDALDALLLLTSSSAPVDSVFGRIGAVLAVAGDYDASQVDNDSGVAGAFVRDALNALNAGKVPNTRTLFAGAGLVGTGDLSADRTINVVANPDGSIVVNANDLRVGVLATDAQHGSRGGGSLHPDATGVTSGFMSSGDKAKLGTVAMNATNTPLTAVAPANVTKAAAVVGVASAAARSDHKHDVATAAPLVGVGAGSSEGVATSLARSDHNHAIRTTDGPTDLAVGAVADGEVLQRSGGFIVGTAVASLTGTAPVNVTKSAALVGVDTDAARGDHKHDVATAAPSVGTGIGNMEGSATELARADHGHAIRTTDGPTDLTMGAIADGELFSRSGTSIVGVTAAVLTAAAPEDVTKSAASVGVSATAARSDHKHDIVTGVPVSVAAANAEGTATTLARSDHAHDHGSLLGGTLHAVATGALAGFMSTADKTKLDGIETGATADQSASDVAFVPSGDIAATDVQAAVVEVRDDTDTKLSGKASTVHAAAHSDGGGDDIDVTDLAGYPGGATTFLRDDGVFAVPLGGSDELVKVSANDTTAGYLLAKVAAGTGIAFAELNDGADEDLEIAATTAAPATGIGGGNAEGAAATLARSDHNHALRTTTGPTDLTIGAVADGEVLQRSGAAIVGTTVAALTGAAPADVTKAAAAVGVATTAARADHKHDVTTAAVVAVGTANTEGSATSLARSDHVHSHGNQAGGALHANVIAAGASGFMTGADKSILNNRGNVAQARRTTAYVLTTAFVDITLDATDLESNAAVLDHDLVTNTDRILIGVTGLYRLYFRVQGSLDFNNQVQGRIRVNDTTVIPGSLSSIGGDSHNNDHPYELSKVVYASLTSGDFISLQLQGTPAVGTSTANANIMFSAEKL